MKIGEWLKKNVASHGIFDDKIYRQKFLSETGKNPVWRTHSVGNTNSKVGKFKGPIGIISGDDHEKVAYGWEMAIDISRKYAGRRSSNRYSGRGRQFEAAIEDLMSAGL